jgi:hypothetical protein
MAAAPRAKESRRRQKTAFGAFTTNWENFGSLGNLLGRA